MRVIAVGLSALALVACVSSGTHEALQSEHDALEARYATLERDSNETILGLEDAIAKGKARAASLEAERAKLEARLESLRGEKAGLLSDKTRLEAAEVEMKRALDQLAKRKAQADARVAAFKDLLSRFKSLIDAGKLKVKIIDGKMVVELATDVLFASGSANLSRDGKAAVIEVTGVLASIAEREFQVAGHTDDVPIRTSVYRSNWELAFARAMAVVKTMVDNGMPSSRISAASYAEFLPAASNETDQGRAANRRIEIIVVPDLSTLPGAEELKQAGS